MGACRVAAVAVLLLAAALLASPASGRVPDGEKPSSGEGAAAPATTTAGSPEGGASEEPGHSSAAGQKPESNMHEEVRPSATTSSKDSKVTSPSDAEKVKQGKQGSVAQASTPAPAPPNKGQGGGEVQPSTPPPPPSLSPLQDTTPNNAQPSTSTPPPPPVHVTPPPPSSPQVSPPPPGGPGPKSGGEATGGDTGSQGNEDAAGKMKEVVEKCDASRKCTGGEFSACLQVSQNASNGSSFIVLNEGQDEITVNVKAPPNIHVERNQLHLAKGHFKQVVVTPLSPGGGNITLTDGNSDCVLGLSDIGQSVSDWQQQFQQFTAYATRLNPIYGASFFVLTVVFVGVVCACCKFARRRGSEGVPYQQLEMGAQAPNSAGADNTASTTDGWEDGWDDDWDDEEAPARPSDKIPASSVSANGLSLRSQINGKDGWDVDWDD
ncbi:hypothetical protein ACP4OV_028933 [Aristida adscensionis]